MRTILPLLALLPLLFGAGCGKQISDSVTDGGPPHGGDDDSYDGGLNDGGCSNDIPTIACQLPCGGGTTGLECVNGTWECPSYDGVDCPPPPDDGGPDACSYTVGACSGISPCEGVYETPVCYDGTWSCEWNGVCEDGGAPDAPYEFDGGQALFACGDQACDPTTSYCQITTGGPVNEDGGPSSGYWCEPLPSSCANTAATCDCVLAFEGVSSSCSCIGHGGDVILTCDF